MRWASVALPGVVLCALPCTCSMTGFRSMNTCVAAHAINGFGSDIMLILPNNDAYCDLCDLISATCKIRCSCIESHAVKTCCILAVRSLMYTGCIGCVLACCPGRYQKFCILACCPGKYQKCYILACCPGRYQKCCILACYLNRYQRSAVYWPAVRACQKCCVTGFLFVHVSEVLYT